MTVETIHDPDPFNTGNVAAFTSRRPGQQLAVGEDKFARMAKWLELFMGTAKVANHLANTAFVPDAMRGRPEDIAAAMMKGLELGIDPLDALANMHVVKGKVGFSAEFMRRRIIERGHEIEFLETTDDRCKIRGRRAGAQEWQTVTFTAENARKAKINLGDYPGDKLVARASSRLCKRVFPDVLSGVTIIEDVIDGEIIEILDDPQPHQQSAPRTLQRKRQPRKQAEAKVAQPKAAEPQERSSDLDEFPSEREPDPDEADARSERAESAGEEYASGPRPEPPVEIRMASKPQIQKLLILLKEERIEDRETRLAWCSQAIGRELASSNDLTFKEASDLIDLLEQDPQQEGK